MPDVTRLSITPEGPRCALRMAGSTDASTSALFIHGLGDSSLAWEGVLADPRFAGHRLIAPDLAGYGATGAVEGYGFGFADQVRFLGALLETMEVTDLVVVGHSMGGVIGSLLCAALGGVEDGFDWGRMEEIAGCSLRELVPEGMRARVWLRGFLNVEGNVVHSHMLISQRAATAQQRGAFGRWFDAFIRTTDKAPWKRENPNLDHYATSIRQCVPEAFLACALDLKEWRTAAGELGGSAGGELYRALNVPRLYVHGLQELDPTIPRFLDAAGLARHPVAHAGHWPMQDNPEEFRDLLRTQLDRW